MSTAIDYCRGWCCPVDAMTCYPGEGYFLRRIGIRTWDEDGHERGQRINGLCECPKCGLHWPCIEEPDMWEEGAGGLWFATGWWGAAECPDCGTLMIEQPDGTPEAYFMGEG